MHSFIIEKRAVLVKRKAALLLQMLPEGHTRKSLDVFREVVSQVDQQYGLCFLAGTSNELEVSSFYNLRLFRRKRIKFDKSSFIGVQVCVRKVKKSTIQPT